ncbi:hypothetical protein HAX54_004464 [Datura stramonium]|uniref:Protein kinase domain-containing protein n=1 Tax=Datura stramonium TaxID=4076 RepID=A0ABS8T721_DATST|nr:hypothetical protein [Datura stramonium]
MWESLTNCCNLVGVTCNSGRVVKLELGKRRLNGKLSESLGNLDQLRTLNLSHNFLKGPVPFTLLHLPKLEVLDLSNNDFSGLFPDSINLPLLQIFNISDNSFEGPIPVGDICENSTRVSVFKMGVNYFNGSLPARIGNCGSLEHLCSNSNLLVVYLMNCLSYQDWLCCLYKRIDSRGSLAARLLKTATAWTGHEPFDWNSSTLDWRFPVSILSGFIQQLLTGEIPKEITGLKSLITGRIGMNEPSPDFPFFLKRNVSGRGLQYNQIFSFPPTLELGNNFLTGAILPEFGNLKRLHVLDLKSNNLSGTIPSSLSAREVPTGGQFPTFPTPSFEGNPGLCGEHGTSVKMPAKFLVIRLPKERGEKELSLAWLIRKRELDAASKELEDLGSSLVIFFHNKENNKEMCLDDLFDGTNNFDQSNIVGCGGFGLVYKAILRDGRKVAIKRLSGDYGQMEREFQAEVESLKSSASKSCSSTRILQVQELTGF